MERYRLKQRIGENLAETVRKTRKLVGLMNKFVLFGQVCGEQNKPVFCIKIKYG